MLELTAGIVTYNSNFELLEKTINTFEGCSIRKELFIHDNSSQEHYFNQLQKLRLKNLISGPNQGFGFGHNRVLEQLPPSTYHLILNPDVEIPPGALERMIAHMNEHQDIVLMVPKILNPDGSIQMLNKRPPSFFNLFARRFLPKILQRWSLIKKKMDSYIMLDKGYTSSYEVPYLSGSFMLFRRTALEKIEGFDERFFMYLEDADITRRAAKVGKCLYFSEASIIHHWSRASHKSLKLTLVSIKSSFKYFNKWGWTLF
ncbi:MAG: glycosyltransferase family 2 protein [Lentisphaeraceae bacterium]|nr:glycosyltransferase family 2 protein [Lentisphaeraceae bacterium]